MSAIHNLSRNQNYFLHRKSRTLLTADRTKPDKQSVIPVCCVRPQIEQTVACCSAIGDRS